MDLSALNKIAEREFLPKKRATDMEKDHQYMVIALKEVKTRFGTKIVAELDDSFQVFLPEKISSAILKDEAFFNSLCNSANKLCLFLKYLGGSSFKFDSSTQ
ncbi:uncharacterized protein LOC116417725 [Nasonia vitripennis]|uniref:Uncharacterized protein n=1 Tax=Nasonia vitripennis TaxID=7425 RepID=A0A7M7QLM4_NASVI|nr:uncharacterized protein LOC116417725 [Nasonia vitripennis]